VDEIAPEANRQKATVQVKVKVEGPRPSWATVKVTHEV